MSQRPQQLRLVDSAVQRIAVDVDQAVLVVVGAHGEPPLPGARLRVHQVGVNHPGHIQGSVHPQVTTAALDQRVVLQHAVLADDQLELGVDGPQLLAHPPPHRAQSVGRIGGEIAVRGEARGDVGEIAHEVG